MNISLPLMCFSLSPSASCYPSSLSYLSVLPPPPSSLLAVEAFGSEARSADSRPVSCQLHLCGCSGACCTSPLSRICQTNSLFFYIWNLLFNNVEASARLGAGKLIKKTCSAAVVSFPSGTTWRKHDSNRCFIQFTGF